MSPKRNKVLIGVGVALLVAVALGQLARHQKMKSDDEKALTAAENDESNRGRSASFNTGTFGSGGNGQSAGGKRNGKNSGGNGALAGSGAGATNDADGTTSEGAIIETEAETRERERYERAQAEAFKYRKLDPNKVKPTELTPAFEDSSKKYNIPEHLLAAIAYVESGGAHRDGGHSMEAGYGVMNLRENNLVDTAAEAAALIGKTKEDIFYDQRLNIEASAALLSRYYDDALASGVSESEAWYMAVSQYSGRPNPELAAALADETAGFLIKGFTANLTDGGGSFSVPPNPSPLFLPKNWKLVGLEPPGGAQQNSQQANAPTNSQQ